MQDTNGYTNGYIRGVSESRAGCGSVHLFSLVPPIAENPPIGALQCYCSPTSRALPVSGTIAIRCHTLCCAPGDTTRVTTWGDSRHDSLYITSPIPSVRRRRLVQSHHPLSLARMPSLATAGQHSRRFMNEGTPRSWDIRVPCRQLQTQTPTLLDRERRPTLARDS